MHPPTNPQELKNGDNCTSYNYHHHSKLGNSLCFGAAQAASTHMETSKLKGKKRKAAELLDGGGHGGRVVHPVDRKDKHSKVSTSRGPRDRRLRLSPKTAIQFYDVQDRLGYDRPSKAIDWLINEAKAAIDALEEPPPPSFRSANAGCGMIFENDEMSTVPAGFSFFLDGSQPSRDFNPLSSLDTWNCEINGNSIPHFQEREPLQSSVVNYSPIMSNHFLPGFSFSDELSSITGSAALKEDEKENKIAPFQD